jgi:hypothetical protein
MLISDKSLKVQDHKEWFPDTSFGLGGPTVEFIRENGFYVVSLWKDHDSTKEKLIPTPAHLINDIVYIVEVAELTAEELEANKNNRWNAIRTTRNGLLSSTDWTQLADSPVNKAAWATYRQELRDITLQEDPLNIVWPIAPN